MIFAKKSIDGLAKLSVQAEKGITTWAKLKDVLKREFEVKVTSADVHKLLMTDKKKKNGTTEEYYLARREIASRANIEQEVVIPYIIDGITVEVANKVVLYGATSYDDFKKKLALYNVFVAKAKTATVTRERTSAPLERRPAPQRSAINRSEQTSRCFNCGEKGHLSRGCPTREKGLKCFGCNRFGHKAADCPEANQRRVNSINESDYCLHRILKIEGQDIDAMIDTGSSVNLNKASTYVRIGTPTLRAETINLSGLGTHQVNTLGSFTTNVEIDKECFETVHVVPDGSITADVLTGNSMLNEAELIIRKGELISVKKISNKNELVQPRGVATDEIFQIMQIDVSDSELDLHHIEDNCLKEHIQELYATYDPKKKNKETPLKMKITLKDDHPIYQKARRLAHQEKLEIVRQMEDLLRQGIIRPSQSDFASPIVLVKKKNGDVRICQDCRKLNQQIIKDRYPLPLIEDH